MLIEWCAALKPIVMGALAKKTIHAISENSGLSFPACGCCGENAPKRDLLCKEKRAALQR